MIHDTTLAVDIAEATTQLAMAKVAQTTEIRTAHLNEVLELTGWAQAEPAARALYREAQWML